jgi:hypothetical protein
MFWIFKKFNEWYKSGNKDKRFKSEFKFSPFKFEHNIVRVINVFALASIDLNLFLFSSLIQIKFYSYN